MALFLLFLLAAAFFAAGYFFTRIAVYPKVIPYDETRRREIEGGKFTAQEFDAWPCEEHRIRSPFGYDLHAQYYPIVGSQKTVVIVHGITWSLFGSVKYMPIFRKRGFNVLIFDNRFHGLSGGRNCTFGFYEKHDLKAVVNWAVARLGTGGIVGTHGESLGAATVLQHAGIDARLSFVIADCPYSDLTPLFAYRLKMDYHLPSIPLLNVASMVCDLLTGMKFSDVRPIEVVRNVKTPILFCHGQQDDYIPPSMSVDMHTAKRNGISRLYLAPNAKHAEAYWHNQAEYDQKVGEFLAEIGLE
jgi:uncharacterized protein